MAEESSHELRENTRALTEELKEIISSQELEVLEQDIAAAVQSSRSTSSERPTEIIKRTIASTVRVAS